MPARIPPIRFPPVWKRRRWPRSCLGPYVMQAYRCRTFSAATNKPPILPYRGVARSGVCFALEVTLDAVARQAGLEPHEVRLRNLVPADAMPFDNITAKHFDSGDYPECLRRVVQAIDIPAVRRRQAEMTGSLRIGVGCTIFCEQARAWHVGLCRLGHTDGAGLRAGGGAHDTGWRA